MARAKRGQTGPKSTKKPKRSCHVCGGRADPSIAFGWNVRLCKSCAVLKGSKLGDVFEQIEKEKRGKHEESSDD